MLTDHIAEDAFDIDDLDQLLTPARDRGQITVCFASARRRVHRCNIHIDDTIHSRHRKALNRAIEFGHDHVARLFQRSITYGCGHIQHRYVARPNTCQPQNLGTGTRHGDQRGQRHNFLHLEHVDAVELLLTQLKQQQCQAVVTGQACAFVDIAEQIACHARFIGWRTANLRALANRTARGPSYNGANLRSAIMDRFVRLSQFLSALIVGLGLLLPIQTVSARDDGRAPPEVSQAETLRLFRQQRFDEAFRHALHRFQWGDDGLHYPLGYMYQQGKGTPLNFRLAREHYSAAAERGHVESMYQLGNMNLFGDGAASNRREACRWYKRAAERRHLDATYQLALCYLNGQGMSKNSELGLSLLHRNALRLDEKAVRSLRMHYAREGINDSAKRAAYKTSERLTLAGQPKAAQKAAEQAVEQGDYRGYASLADSLRQQQAAPPTLIQDMYTLGEMFGSPLAVYNVGQRLLQQGKTTAACKQFEIAFNHSLPQAGVQVAECYRAGDLASRKPEFDACKTFERASKQGSAEASMSWARCLTSDLFKPLDAEQVMLAYTRAVIIEPSLVDASFAQTLCPEGPFKLIARDATLTLFNSESRALDAFEQACLVRAEDDGNSSRIFLPAQGLYGVIDSAKLLPIIDVDGFALAKLTRKLVRDQLYKNEKYMAQKLSDRRDELKVNFLQDTTLIITYDSDGNATSLTRVIDDVSDKARFHGRVTWLSSMLEAQAEQSTDDKFLSARWDLAAWNILLMQDLGQQQIRERYSFSDE